MDYTWRSGMHVINSTCSVIKKLKIKHKKCFYLCSLAFIKFAYFFQFTVKMAPSELHDHVYICIILKEGLQVDNARVLEVHVDLDFILDLLFHFELAYLGFAKRLYSILLVRNFVSDVDYTSKRTLSKDVHQLEIRFIKGRSFGR